MDEQMLDNQLEPIYNSSVLIQDVALKTSWERWTVETGGKRGSGRSVLAVRHDDDDIYCIYAFIIYTLYTGWNDKIVVLKKTTLQLYFKTFIEKINSGNLIM